MRTFFEVSSNVEGMCIVLQGAAFDVPQEIADKMMANVEELTKRGFELDMPTSLPEEPFRGGGGGGGRGGGRGG